MALLTPTTSSSASRGGDQAQKETLQAVLWHLAYRFRGRGGIRLEKGCDTLVVGTGQYGNVHLSPEAAEFFTNHDCRVVLQPTPQAIKAFNKAKGRAIGLFHVTC